MALLDDDDHHTDHHHHHQQRPKFIQPSSQPSKHQPTVHHYHHKLYSNHQLSWFTSSKSLIVSYLLLLNIVTAVDNHSLHSNYHNNNNQNNNGPRPPRIKEHPNSVVVKKHEPVTLSCRADGNPEPVIEWYRDNELVKESQHYVYLNGDLFIYDVMNYKAGVYYCLARNSYGKARSHNATIEIASIRDEFRTLPKNIYVTVNDAAILECLPPRGFPEPQVQWRKDGEMVPLVGRYRLSGSNLHITNVQPEDAGRFQCIAQNKAGSRESPPAQLIVRMKPYFIVKPEDVTALANKMAEIQCKVGGDPTPKVSWRREGGQISSRASTMENKSLRFENVTEDDEGLYVCEAENLVDRISHSANLIVHSKPTFLVEPQDVRVNVNGVAKFDCVASGNPRPSVFWTKEGNQFLMFPDNKYERFSVTPEGSLIISPVKKEDKGYYVCSALSVVSSATTKAFLNISSLADLPPPIIVLGPADQILAEHTTGMLPCDATGSPQPSLKWFFNHNPIQVNSPRFNVLDTGTLQIDDLQLSDSGEYRCLAYSENGESTWSAHLKVVSPHSTNTKFHRMPDPATYPDAPSRPNIVNVTDNSISISWLRTGRDGASPFKGVIVEYFSPDHHNEWIKAAKGITTDKFTITGLKSGSRYYFLVRAWNDHGIGPPSPISYEARTLSHMAANHLPNRMLDLTDVRRKLENIVIELKDVRTLSSSAVKLFWNVRGNQEYIEGFYIRYRIIDPKNLSIDHEHTENIMAESKYNMVTVYNVGTSTYIINNLPKYTTFEFFLVPFYKSIDGKPSNSRVVRTLEGVPSSPPAMIKTRPLSSSTALITWQPPPSDQINGLLLGYILFVHGAYTPYNINLTVNSNTTSYLLRNLTSETEYIIQITAFTSVGVGVPSAPLTFIMDPLLSADIYNERNVAGVFDSSNVWICVLIISLIILSLIVLLLGFLLLKKRSALLKKNHENFTLSRELKTQNEPFYQRHLFAKPCSIDSRPTNDIKQASSGPIIKMSPTLVPTDNNGYSTVTTDDQAADYADYDYVSQHENNYESTYEYGRDGPVAYASSTIIANSNSPFRMANQPTPSLPHSAQPPHHPWQWRTQFNVKNDNYMKPSYTATLDRNALGIDNRYKKNLYDGNNIMKNINVTEPLIGNHLNDYEDASNHYHYADSAAYCGNVTQIPPNQLMANQFKYGSLSRINKQQQQQAQQQYHENAKNFLHDNYKKNPIGSNEWKSVFMGGNESNRDNPTMSTSTSSGSSHKNINNSKSQFEFDTKVFGKTNRHLITNPLTTANNNNQTMQTNSSNNQNFAEQRQQSPNNPGPTSHTNTNKINDLSIMYKVRKPGEILNNNKNMMINICDSESTYQELT